MTMIEVPNGKVGCIAYYRKFHDVGLREGKEAVEGYFGDAAFDSFELKTVHELQCFMRWAERTPVSLEKYLTDRLASMKEYLNPDDYTEGEMDAYSAILSLLKNKALTL